MTVHFPFDNTYGRLPDRFFTRQMPEPVANPTLIKINTALATQLNLDPDLLGSPEGVAILAGNAVPEGADPLAQVYAGHQFGGWSPQLGDGRALLLGEIVDREGHRRDIQLKGSGRTPYSRMGDGRAWLGPVLREYIVSEAMFALGVPTTRALAAVSTGQPVFREGAMPGAVLTRVAASHIRVGTFQFFAARQDLEALEALTGHAIARHYPGADSALDLLNCVIEAQARLVSKWLALGFIHGVMNTDNTTISGETIDYGPCAFMDGYVPEKVYSSIDHGGRYAYLRQPDILVWNLAQLATALLPLIHPDRDAGVEIATAAVHRFPDLFRQSWLSEFRAKLGLATAEDGDDLLVHQLLDLMAASEADFTNTFRALGTPAARDHFLDRDAFDHWAEAWSARLAREGRTPETVRTRIEKASPAVTPRNHRVEEAISAAVTGDFTPFERLVSVLAKPFAIDDADADLSRPPAPEEEVRQTFCGT